MLTQNLPTAASDYAASQRLEQRAAIAAVLRQWQRMGTDFDSSYARIAPTLLAIVSTAQSRIALQSAAYIPAVLEETGQTAAIAAVAQTNTQAIVGVTGTGARVAETLAIATIQAKTAVGAGQTTTQALRTASDWLTGTVGTILSDTGRTIESLGMATRPVGGYVRMLNPPSCARCVVQAGRWFRKNQGFERHPECDCRHIPASEAVGDDIRINPNDYFDSLDDAGKLKLAGSKANLKALEDGADLIQIVNAYRRTNGMIVAGVSPIRTDRFGDKYTTEGTTRRGAAGQQQAALRRNGPSQLRLMPASIYKAAKDQDDALRLLRLYGWISDDDARLRGRSIFAEQRREGRNTRARARRAEAKETAAAPATATGSGGSAGRPPTNPPIAGGALPDPSDKAAWKARQEALGLDFGANELEPHEIEFLEQFKVGRRIEGIEAGVRNAEGRRPATNDIKWWITETESIDVEVRSVLNVRQLDYRAAARKVRDATEAGKRNVILDLRGRALKRQLLLQLRRFNTNQTLPERRVDRLWVWSRGELIPIALEE